MSVWWVRAIIFSALMTLVATGFAAAQTAQRPPVGGIGQLPDAMIFYVAHGAPGACGKDARIGLPPKASSSGTPTSG
jgi:hypothetical protein